MIIYFWNHKYEYTHSDNAKISPLDAENGDTVYLIPSNATSTKPPTIPAGKKAIWDIESSEWTLEDIIYDYIDITTTTRLYRPRVERDIVSQFGPATSVGCEIDIELDVEKTIRFGGVQSIPDNVTWINDYIDTHVNTDARMDEIMEERDSRLSDTDWKFKRHRDQEELVLQGHLTKTTWQGTEYIDWLYYAQLLRDFPATCNVMNPAWPEEPDGFLDCIVSSGPDLISDAGHGLTQNDKIEIEANVLPDPITANVEYFVAAPGSTTFKLSATASGGIIDITTDGTGVKYRKRYIQ